MGRLVKLKHAHWEPTEHSTVCSEHFKEEDFFSENFFLKQFFGKICMYVCLLITLTRSPKAELRRAQLNGIGQMHMKGSPGCCQTVMNDPGAQQPSQVFLTWVRAGAQHRELRALLLTNSVWVL